MDNGLTIVRDEVDEIADLILQDTERLMALGLPFLTLKKLKDKKLRECENRGYHSRNSETVLWLPDGKLGYCRHCNNLLEYPVTPAEKKV